MNQKKERYKTRLLVFGLYSKLIEYIQQYENVQTVLRTMSSTAFLATSAVIGFLFSSEVKSLPFSYLTCVIFVCCLGICVITSLGLLDLVFQERMIIASFVEALKYEKEHPWLPKMHSIIEDRGKHHGSPHRKAVYYIGTNVCLIAIICIATGFYLDKSLTFKFLISISLFVVLSIIYSSIFSRIVKTFDQLVKIEQKFEGSVND